MKTYTCAAAFLVLVAAALLAGCKGSKPASNAPGQTPPPAGTLRITPIDLFPGDLKRIQPFVVDDFGSAIIQYSGPKKNLRYIVELWEKGVSKFAGSGGAIVTPGSNEEHVVSVGLKRDGLKEPMLVVSMQGGSVSSKLPLVIDPEKLKLAASGSHGMSKPYEGTDDEEVPVWCLVVSEHGVGSQFQEELKRAHWGILVKITATDKDVVGE